MISYKDLFSSFMGTLFNLMTMRHTRHTIEYFMKSALYGIYALVVDISEISLVHSFDL